jgi:hypothetical protein
VRLLAGKMISRMSYGEQEMVGMGFGIAAYA